MSGVFNIETAVLPGQALTWLQELRAEASLQFSQFGLPSPRAEDWRYTPVSALAKKAFNPILTTNHAVDVGFINAYQLADAWSLVLVDGHFRNDYRS